MIKGNAALILGVQYLSGVEGLMDSLKVKALQVQA